MQSYFYKTKICTSKDYSGRIFEILVVRSFKHEGIYFLGLFLVPTLWNLEHFLENMTVMLSSCKNVKDKTKTHSQIPLTMYKPT